MRWHIKQGSLCCSRLSRIKALHAPRDAVIGAEEDGTNAEKWIPLDPAAEPSRTLESLQHLIAPSPHLQNKEAEREEASLQVKRRTEAPGSLQLMRGRRHSDAASAYNGARENATREAEAQKVMPLSLDSSVLICKDKKLSAYIDG